MMFFGPGGNGKSFAEMGYKSSLQVPEYIIKMGLNAYEYECGRGVNIKEEKCKALKEKAEEYNVKLSLHAPYYISMSSIEEEKRLNSLKYIYDSAKAANFMGADRIVIHTGSCGKLSRTDALIKAKDTMQKAIDLIKKENLYNIRLCPETMGKINQLGTLYEVLELCALDENLMPCIDFGHLNARTHGELNGKEKFEQIFSEIENKLGNDRMRNFHVHFSKIEYTEGGEKRHLTFADNVYGPDFEPMLETAYKKNCSLTVICESDGTQAEDAKLMKNYWESL